MRRAEAISERRCHAHGGLPAWACKATIHFMPTPADLRAHATRFHQPWQFVCPDTLTDKES